MYFLGVPVVALSGLLSLTSANLLSDLLTITATQLDNVPQKTKDQLGGVEARISANNKCQRAVRTIGTPGVVVTDVDLCTVCYSFNYLA